MVLVQNGSIHMEKRFGEFKNVVEVLGPHDRATLLGDQTLSVREENGTHEEHVVTELLDRLVRVAQENVKRNDKEFHKTTHILAQNGSRLQQY